MRVALVAWVVLVLASPVLAMSPRRSNETRMVRVLYIGDRPTTLSPFRFMVQDPFLDMTPVKASRVVYESDVIRKSIRVYMPRSYLDLAQREDVIIISDANCDVFEAHMLKWISDGVVEDGMGFLMTGGREGFGGYWGMPDWTLTAVAHILPVEAPHHEKGPTARVEILKPGNRFIASLPWSKIGRYGVFYGFNTVSEKEGSEVLANLVAEETLGLEDFYLTNPFLVWWDIGRGRSFAMTSGWTPAMGTSFIEWEYYPDYATNLVLFIADLPVPDDPLLVHRVRSRLNQYHSTRDFVVSMIEFVDRFGANPESIEQLLGETDQELRQVDALYMEYDFEASLARVDWMIAELDGTTELALKLKDQALLWVYIVEWLAVTATGIVTAAAVWGLMVRRIIYRAVTVTRLSHADAND